VFNTIANCLLHTKQPPSVKAHLEDARHAFVNDPDGQYPVALIQATDGRFYGATAQGGISGSGTVFVMYATGTVTTLYRFPGSTEGAGPQGPLVQASDGNFYGTTYSGGPDGHTSTAAGLTLAFDLRLPPFSIFPPWNRRRGARFSSGAIGWFCGSPTSRFGPNAAVGKIN